MPTTPLISVIDDDESLRLALVGLIRSLGFQAHGHATAEAFLESGDIGETRCVITDIQMPGMSGIDLKHLLDSRAAAVPVIMITARTEAALIERARRSGALCLLCKPFETDDLIAWLDRALAV
jgi:FixJ family two-component response regulator